jgi:hypothetical protein
MQSQKPFYSSTFKGKVKSYKPTGKVRLRFSHTNLFKIARGVWSLCTGTCWAMTSCNSWSTEAKSRLCSRTRKCLAWGSLLTILITKIRPLKPRVREEYMASFMHIFSTNKVPRVLLWILRANTHFGRNWNQRATWARHGRTTWFGRPCRCGRPGRCGRPYLVTRAWSKAHPFPLATLVRTRFTEEHRFDPKVQARIHGSTCPAAQLPQPLFRGDPRHPWV